MKFAIFNKSIIRSAWSRKLPEQEGLKYTRHTVTSTEEVEEDRWTSLTSVGLLTTIVQGLWVEYC